LHEGLPCALVEARALGLPAFCYNAGGIGEIIVDDINGKLFTIGDWHNLAQELISFWHAYQKSIYSSRVGELPQEFTTHFMHHAHQQLYTELQRKQL
jgi:glycosyltransferase involved in cell wall biosynthesis